MSSCVVKNTTVAETSSSGEPTGTLSGEVATGTSDKSGAAAAGVAAEFDTDGCNSWSRDVY